MKWFGRKDETALIVKEQPVVVAVPDIKEYLIKEYERVNLLNEEKEQLLIELEKAKEFQLKYEATLVTLDEYSKRLDLSNQKLFKKDNFINELNNKILKITDELNSYKIKFNEAAITKEEIKDEIVNEFKNNLVENFNAVKGNLSKAIVAKIINETELNLTEKGGVQE